MFVDFYAIQAVPPSNINRDDTGAPKTAYYGGTLRARVSSQAWKKAMRDSFKDMLPVDKLGKRTKTAASLIQEQINILNPNLGEKSEALAISVLNAAGLKVEASRRAGTQTGMPVTQYLVFIGNKEIKTLAQVAVKWAEEGENTEKITPAMKKEVLNVFRGEKALDIALFGRMLADVPQLNEEASAQVSHAISVDAITQEYDYYTAIDDCADEDNSGAAMLDTVGFNSSTLYRYATVDIDSIANQLGDVDSASQAIAAFAEAFVRSMPTGKQNSYANRTLPTTVVIAIRKEQPINIVDAYQAALQPEQGKSLARKASEIMGDKLASIEKAYGQKPERSWNIVVDQPIEQLDAVSKPVNFEDAKSELAESVKTLLEEQA